MPPKEMPRSMGKPFTPPAEQGDLAMRLPTRKDEPLGNTPSPSFSEIKRRLNVARTIAPLMQTASTQEDFTETFNSLSEYHQKVSTCMFDELAINGEGHGATKAVLMRATAEHISTVWPTLPEPKALAKALCSTIEQAPPLPDTIFDDSVSRLTRMATARFEATARMAKTIGRLNSLSDTARRLFCSYNSVPEVTKLLLDHIEIRAKDFAQTVCTTGDNGWESAVLSGMRTASEIQANILKQEYAQMGKEFTAMSNAEKKEYSEYWPKVAEGVLIHRVATKTDHMLDIIMGACGQKKTLETSHETHDESMRP